MELVDDGSDVSDQIIRKYLNNASVEICAQKCPKIQIEELKKNFVEKPEASVNEKITVFYYCR